MLRGSDRRPLILFNGRLSVLSVAYRSQRPPLSLRTRGPAAFPTNRRFLTSSKLRQHTLNKNIALVDVPLVFSNLLTSGLRIWNRTRAPTFCTDLVRAITFSVITQLLHDRFSKLNDQNKDLPLSNAGRLAKSFAFACAPLHSTAKLRRCIL